MPKNNPRTMIFDDLITEYNITDIEEYDITKYIRKLKDKINIDFYPVKVKIIITSEFTTPMAFDIVESHYSHPIEVIRSENNIPRFFTKLKDSFEAWIDEFQERGSGFIFRNPLKVKVKIYRYNYQRASSYIPLKFKTQSVINVRNNDNKCFTWSVLAKCRPAETHKERVSNYIPHERLLDMTNIEYPVMIKDIPRIERKNELKINVFSLEDQKNKHSLYPVYISNSNLGSNRELDLLYIEEDGNSHYCLIKNLDSFLSNKHGDKQYTCRNCLRGFSRHETLENHRKICLDHNFCRINMPSEDKKILSFKNFHYMNKLPFVIYCDFESTNTSVMTCMPDPKSSYTTAIAKQTVNSYGMYVHSDHPRIYKSQYFSYNGEDAAEEFVRKVIQIYRNLTYNIHLREKKTPKQKPEDEKKYLETKNCYMCAEKLTVASGKNKEYDHLAGKYRGASCNSCSVKASKSKVIPVFFHNGSNYDFHFLIEELLNYENHYDRVQLLPKNSEEYISIDFGSHYRKLRFLDSFRFFQQSLAGVVKSMDSFPILEKEMKDVKPEDLMLLKQKGIYPYEYIDSIDRLQETQLPMKEKFFSTLTQEHIKDSEYTHAQKVWQTFNCRTLMDYHNLYLKTDVLLLADCFEKFRSFFLEHHKIDPCYCFSSPGLTWQCGLKYTNVKLDLLTDYDMLLMFERGIRGGFSGVLGPRHVKAFNKYTPNYDNGERIFDSYESDQYDERFEYGADLSKFTEEKFLLYLDANNLYGWAMSQPLPTKDFKWESDPEYYLNVPEGRGCLVECDLKYTKACKHLTEKYPLAPEKRAAKLEELSDYQKELLGNKPLCKTEKLMLTLLDKERYVIHHGILKEYLKLGMKVIKVHRVISFEESTWLEKYITFNTNQRTRASSDFEKNLWKLMNNSFYGKTLENIRGRTSVKLTTDEHEARNFISKPNFKDSIHFNENFIALINNITSIKFNKPIYLGQAVLDYSKLLMYQFYYNTVNRLWPKNEIIASDTDSLFLSLTTKDVYEDMKKILDQLDTSDYPKDHFLYSPMNKKVIGKFKDELAGRIMYELVYLRSKAYSFVVLGKEPEETKKLKGLGKATIKKDLKFKDYKDCLYDTETMMNKMHVLGSKKHQMYVNEVNKQSLSPFDDKEYIFGDGIDTQPYGL